MVICTGSKALTWRVWRRYFLEVTLICGGSLRFPIVCRSPWKEASVWMWGFGMTSPWLPLLSGCLDRQLSLCVSLNSLVQQRQAVCLCQRGRAAVTLHIYVFLKADPLPWTCPLWPFHLHKQSPYQVPKERLPLPSTAAFIVCVS